MSDKAAAVETVVELGLTEYEARCFVALTQLSSGTAKEISQVADVPQSRVYDVTETLHERGLVDIQESDPRRYFALPIERALARLEREYDATLATATQQLTALETRETDTDGVWEVANREDVLLRMRMHVDAAEERIYLLLGDGELLEQEVLASLAEASGEGVTIYAEVPSEAAKERLKNAVPDCRVAITELPLESITLDDRKPGRLVMIDDTTVLMSARKEGLVPDETEETGLWGSDTGNGLVAWLQALLHARLDRVEFT